MCKRHPKKPCTANIMLLSRTFPSAGFVPRQQPRLRSCCPPQSRSPCAVETQQLTSTPLRSSVSRRRSSWSCNCTVDPSRPVPSDERSRPAEDTPGQRTETPGAKNVNDVASEGRRKGLALMGELKELVTSSNAELKVRRGIRHIDCCSSGLQAYKI